MQGLEDTANFQALLLSQPTLFDKDTTMSVEMKNASFLRSEEHGIPFPTVAGSNDAIHAAALGWPIGLRQMNVRRSSRLRERLGLLLRKWSDALLDE